MIEWFRALVSKSGGPWFKSSTLLLSGFVLGSPKSRVQLLDCITITITITIIIIIIVSLSLSLSISLLSLPSQSAGILYVHQPGANHALRASVTQVNLSVQILSTVLRICADPSMQIF